MNFSKISKVLVSFAFLSVFSCGIISSEESAPVSEDVSSTETSAPSNESSALPAKVDESEEKDKSKDEVVCKNLGSFTVNSAFSKQDSHFGLFRDENGMLSVKDITDGNKNDTNKLGECKSYRTTYNCYVCYYPSCKENDSNSESVDDSSVDEKFESKVESEVESASDESKPSER